MLRPLELFIGLRYLRARRRNQFVSFISLVSLLGIALGVAALIVVLSVMNGFEEEIRARILGMTAHGFVAEAEGPMEDWEAVRASVLEQPGVLGAAPFVAGEAMLASGTRLGPAVVRGVLPALEASVSEAGARIRGGSISELAAGSRLLFVGRSLAASLGVVPGDPVSLLVLLPDDGGMRMPRIYPFRVAGIIEAGHFEYDQTLVLMHLEDAAQVFAMVGGVTGVRIRGEDIFAAPALMRELGARLGDGFRTSDWTQEHVSYFRAIRMEKTVMFVILTLIVAVAAFNIVATLVMVVMDKRADIGILRTLGLAPGRVMGAFVSQGMAVGLVGMVIGVITGVTLALNVETIVPALEGLFGFKLFPGDVFYISDVPSRLEWIDVTAIAAAAVALTVLSTLYPSWRASRVRPVDALRYD